MKRAGNGSGRGVLKRFASVLLPWGALMLAPALLLGPAVARGEVLFWGTPLLQFIPWREFAWQRLAAGQFPLWNPQLGMGAPLLANYQSALLYPPNWLLPLLGVAWGHGPLVILHWIVAGLGMARLAQRLRVDRLGQTVAGLAYALSGYLVARAGFFSINAATAWLPWIVLAVDRICTTPGPGRGWRHWLWAAPGLALPLAMQWLAGHAQTAWYSLVLAAAWWLLRAVGLRPWRRVAVRFVRLAAGGLGALLLAAPQLLPTFEYLLHSQRASSVDPSLAMTYSFWPWRLLELLVPGVFGRPQSGLFWGYANYWEDAIYIGVLPLLLAVAAAIAALRRRSPRPRLTAFLCALGAASLLLALGDNTPLFPWLFDNVPTFDLFQAPTRWNLLLVFSLALLAGFGSDLWRSAEGRALYWLRLGTAGAAAVTGAAWAGARLLQVRPSVVQAFATAGVLLFLAGILALLKRNGPRISWQLAVVTLVGADLLFAGGGLNPTTEPSLYRGASRLSSQVAPEHRVYLAQETERYLTFYESFRFDTFHARQDWGWVRDVGLPNSTMLDGIASADNFDPLLPGRFAAWLEALEALPPGQREKWLRMMDVGAYAGELGPSNEPSYRRIDGAARARWVGQAHWVASGQAALAHMAEPGFEPAAAVVLEGDGPQETAAGEGRVGPVQDLGPGSVAVAVEASHAGWLVLSDSWYPGWRAYVDGQRAELLRANFLFRAVPVPPGSHLVEFRFMPLPFVVGLALALIGVILLLAARRKRLGF